MYIKKSFSYHLFSSFWCDSPAFLYVYGDIFYFPHKRMIMKKECLLQITFLKFSFKYMLRKRKGE